ncbi:MULTISPECIES: methionyl-tRNA formyltransferase [unclassified Leucobacter]|uniref:methionyl-tRNA formyltransferase n=1 Tax=unclassified Leucobacter TaxID=2621730 RepID=UPI00165D4403|nr:MULTISPECIES: methionyl-tRNA formyltransferase [unclassified Leucobacter]MBC9935220.1 methionyl-tRNA formyltransferase [Leucobacter sp. cx-87]
MRIVFAGTPEVAAPSLRALVAAGHEVLAVITREDAPLGRKRVLTPSPVADAAEALGLPVIKANTLGEAVTAQVAALAPDLGVVVAYGGLIREPLLSTPVHGWINLHFSDLPRWRGAAPVQRALMAGEQELGLTVFRLVAALDAGDVLTRDALTVPAGTSAGDALALLAEHGTASLLAAVEGLDSGALAGEPQVGETSYAHKLDRSHGHLDPRQPAAQILAHWAGVTPEPGATLETDGASLKVHAITLTSGASPAPGVVALVDGKAVLGTVDGIGLALDRVQPAGKPAMDGAAWLRGRGGSVVVA